MTIMISLVSVHQQSRISIKRIKNNASHNSLCEYAIGIYVNLTQERLSKGLRINETNLTNFGLLAHSQV